jgi:hypothetical protein
MNTSTRLDTPCLEWTGAVMSTGYGERNLGDGRIVLVHRLAVAEVDGWEAIEGKFVLHLCDNRLCYRYDHLRIGTAADNSADMVAKGRSCTGEKHWRSKLTEEDVVAIRRRRAAGETTVSLGLEFGVSPMNIGLIANRKRWRHVP